MLTIRDLSGNEELLTDHKELNRNRKVNGEKTISLTLLPTVHNAHSFPLVEEESILEFDGEEYVIKKMQERNIGNTYIKRVDAIHKFYVDLINKQQPAIHNGSITFNAYMQRVFEGTGYTFSVIDTFNAQSFENLGNDNRLSLLQKGLERFKAEMELVGNDVRFKKQVGNDSDFQFRYGHNIMTIERNVDTTNLATVIRGKGAPLSEEEGAERITAYYRSPNADIFGEIDTPPVEDERFYTEDSLLAEMKARLQDTPEFSITIDFVDLRAAGYPWTVPNEGDRVFVIYEPMNDLLIETRILEINEVYDAKGKVIKTDVTLSNYKKTFAGTIFNNVQKQLRNIVDEDGIIRFDALSEQIKRSTEAILGAETELEFTEAGIIARSKNNPNHLVVYNSAGFGISLDNGVTFTEAVTTAGFNLSVGAIGHLDANNVSIGNNKILLSNDGLFVYKNNIEGASLVEGNLTFNDQENGARIGRFAATVWSDGTTKGISMNMEKDRFISFGHFVDPETGYTPILLLNPGNNMAGNVQGIHMNLPIRMNRDVWLGTNALRLGENNTHNHSALWHGADDSAILAGYTGVRLAYLTAGGVVNDRLTVDSNSVDAWQDLDMHGWKLLRVAEVQQSSSLLLKTNIEDFTDPALPILKNLQLKKFHFQSDIDQGNFYNEQIGLISQMSPEVANIDQTAVQQTKLVHLHTKAFQEVSAELEAEKKRTNALETVVGELSTENDLLKEEMDLLKQQLNSVLLRLTALEEGV